MIPETIHWHLVSEQLPDSDISVLLHAPGSSEPVWIGFYDSERDLWVSDGLVDYPSGQVKAWGEIPEGPRL